MPPQNFACTCKDGFSGDGKTCVLIDECVDETHNCDPNASCIKSNTAGFTCVCNSGYSDRFNSDGVTFFAGLEGLACIDDGSL